MTKTLTEADLKSLEEWLSYKHDGVWDDFRNVIAMARQRNELLEVVEKLVSRADETLNSVPPKSATKLRDGGDCEFSISNKIIMEGRAAIAKGEAS